MPGKKVFFICLPQVARSKGKYPPPQKAFVLLMCSKKRGRREKESAIISVNSEERISRGWHKEPCKSENLGPRPSFAKEGLHGHVKSFNLVGFGFLTCKLKQLNWLTLKVSTGQN